MNNGNKVCVVLSTLGMVSWLVYIFNPLEWLKLIIGVGYAISYGAALVYWFIVVKRIG